jgi:hypothetical protein
MTNFICLLDHWQSLAGAFVGGISGLVAALVVAGSANRREQRAAAMLLIGDLTAIGAAGENLRQLAEKQSIPADKHPMWLANMLIWSRPKLSVLFESSMVRVMPVDNSLVAHLNLLKTIYAGIEEELTRLTRNIDAAKGQSNGILARSMQEQEADARLIAMGFERIVAHAEYANMLIANLIFSRCRVWHRIRMRLLPNNEEKECARLLREGTVR